METYFTKFPTITYANNNMRDLSRRVVLANNLAQIPTAFYPYDLTDEMRSDVVAHTYYNDSDADWLIYIINGIVDPYYGWYLNETEFNRFIIQKYGDLTLPQQKIAYWVTNWTETDINVTTTFYERLASIQQKYWIPVWGPKASIIAYKRRPEDWMMNVNKILHVEVANTSVFSVGDLVQSIDVGNNIIGTGEVLGVESNNSILQIGNVLDHWEDNNAVSVQVRNDETTITAITDTIVEAVVNITVLETDYWTPIYYYDMERELNESRKTIMLLDAQYLGEAARGIMKKLKET